MRKTLALLAATTLFGAVAHAANTRSSSSTRSTASTRTTAAPRATATTRTTNTRATTTGRAATTPRAATLAGCFDACASKRPAASDHDTFASCMSTHVTAAKERVKSIRRQRGAAKDAAWREVHAARDQHATRCAPASVRAWNDCMRQCRGR